MAWLLIVLLSASVGVVAGWCLPIGRALLAGALLPWLGMLFFLLFNEYVLPYEDGGASMWPLAQLFAGTAAAVSGLLGAVLGGLRSR